MSAQNRPREKAERLGMRFLSDAEVLALLLKSGSVQKGVLEIARDLLEKYPLRALPGVSLKDLCSFEGIGKAKGLELLAALELSRRILEDQTVEKKLRIEEPSFEKWLISELGYQDREHFLLICLDRNDRMLSHDILYIGTSDSSPVSLREILEKAISRKARSILIAHNHPSGNPQASEADRKMTEMLIRAASELGIEMKDHLIVADQTIYSLRKNWQNWQKTIV